MDPMSNLALLGADIRSGTAAGNSAQAPESLVLRLAGGNAAEGGALGLTPSDTDAGEVFVISFQELIDALASGKGLPAGGNPLPPAVEGLPVMARAVEELGADEDGLAGPPRAELLQWLVQRLQRELPPAGLSEAQADGDPAPAAVLAPLVQQLLAAGGSKLQAESRRVVAGEPASAPPLDLFDLAPALERSLRPSSPVASAVHQVLFAGEPAETEAGAADMPDLTPAMPRAPVATPSGMPSAMQQVLAAVGVRLPEPSTEASVPAPGLAGSVSATGLSAGGSAVSFASGTAAPTSLRPEFSVADPFGSERWAQAVGERVLMLVGRDHQVAELKLSPPNLGTLEVRVSVQQDQTSVAFVSQHAAVRDALEQAIPRLREMLAQQDLQLVSVDVSQRETGQQAASGDTSRGGSGGGGGGTAGDGSPLAESGTQPGRVLQGMVDLFA